MKRIIQIGIGCVVMMLLATMPSNAQSDNLLQNPGFEAPFVDKGGQIPRLVANGWEAWHVAAADDEPDFENTQPEYYEATREDRIRSGESAQRYESFFATHTGGVFQVVLDVDEGQDITFEIYVWVWSSGLGDEDVSEDDGDVILQVGIDPTGGTDGTSEDIVWSDEEEQYDDYNLYTVSTTAEANTVSVWVRSQVGLPVNSTQIYLDDASLTVDGEDEPTIAPTKVEADTEVPTIAPTEVATETEAPTMTATATSTLPPSPTQVIEPTETVTPLPTETATFTPVPVEPTSTLLPEQPDSTEEMSAAASMGDTETDIIYQVVAGDTLFSIAQRFGTSVEAIREANGLAISEVIFVGQALVIPGQPGEIMPTQPPLTVEVSPTPIQPESGQQTYIVQPGDTLTRIAQEFNTTAAALAQLNGIVNVNRIVVGQELRVPRVDDLATATPVVTATPDVPTMYTIQPGDNLYRLSLRFGVPLVDIIEANEIENANQIFVGQQIIIP